MFKLEELIFWLCDYKDGFSRIHFLYLNKFLYINKQVLLFKQLYFYFYFIFILN
jgi:hypothetical protein